MTRSAEFRKAAWSRPSLSNIYLHKLDEFVETVTHPAIHPGKAQGIQP